MTRKDIAAALRTVGLKTGAIVLVHSSLSSIGRVEGGGQALFDAFRDVLGKEGTLVVPIFGTFGVLTDLVRSHPDAVRSRIPKGAVAALGPAAAELCAGHWKASTVHGQDTPYTRIAERGGYVCLLGVDQDRSTMLHSVEALLRLPYLARTRDQTFDTPEGTVTKSWHYYPGPHRDFIGLDRALRDSGTMTMSTVGNAVVRLIKGRDLIDICLDLGRKDPAFALCDNPNCPDCVAQRAALNRARFELEPATIAAASSLAGRYVPEMIENLAATGINAIELDVIQGVPVSTMRGDALAKAAAELREAGLAITGMRGPAVSNDAFLEKAKEAGASRVILPLSSGAVKTAAAAAALELGIAFHNAHTGAVMTAEIMKQVQAANSAARLAVSPAGFARLGEKPFLTSYGDAKLRGYMDQLDIEDMTFDGTPQPLAHGNAEIKELISILRCAGFDGTFVLSAVNRLSGTLQAAARRFLRLLDSM